MAVRRNLTPSRILATIVAAGALGAAIAGKVAEPKVSLTGPPPTPGFTAFESGQVRPLALTPDKKLLLATNTPNNRLEIFAITNSGLARVASVTVGLEPVAVAAQSNREAWVVNHLSDSISVVRLDGKRSRIVRTLHVGDEPRDIVFGGSSKSRAFITTAHRGQNNPQDPQFTTPGVGRADVWVFDTTSAHEGTLGGTPLAILTLFTDTPRALAVSPDGSRVYAAGFKTGNKTTVISAAPPPLTPPHAAFPGPATAQDGTPRPANPGTALIVKFDGAHWVDERGQIYDGMVRYMLPDKDVFVIDANANPPRQVAGASGFFTGVGTVIFNMAVNPVSGKVYVSNLESNNAQRFEGSNDFAGHETAPARSLRGRIAFSRITVLGAAGGVTPRHLNKHIDYDTCCAPLPNDENDRSVAFPVDMAITADGQTLYVASLGTSEVAMYDTAALEHDTFVPDVATQIPVSGGGPSGLALDEDRARLYVLTRFDNAIKIIETNTRVEIGGVAMFNPEPENLVGGRRFLYDASFSSSHGDSACASCHIFGDVDELAWDLGNPDGAVLPDPNPFTPGTAPIFALHQFNPLKGPMATQSLRGMTNHGPMHWRGDRTGGSSGPSVQPDGGAYDENAAFLAFNPAFVSLLGRHEELPAEDMRSFAHFILQVTYPPNPIRKLDNSLTPEQQAGSDFYFGSKSFGNNPAVLGDELSCNDCHRIDRRANAEFGVAKPGFFGSDNNTTEIPFGRAQHFKNPHMRNVYQKVGMFGTIFPGFAGFENSAFTGDQVRGFGFSQDATFDTLDNFLSTGFRRGPANPDGIAVGAPGAAIRNQLEAFMLVFDTNLFPIVGQHVTLSADNIAAANPRIDLLLARADAEECDVIAKIRMGSIEVGFLYTGHGRFTPHIADRALRRFGASLGGITYTAVPVGDGWRIAFGRDQQRQVRGRIGPERLD